MAIGNTEEVGVVISSFAPGVTDPIPTLPLVVTYIPEPAVEFDWNLASSPLVDEPVLDTFSKPFVEFKAVLELVTFSKVPVVKLFVAPEEIVCAV